MATKSFFISETYLKENSPLSGNIDIADLYPFVKITEDIHIQETIGTKLYTDLVNKVIASVASPPTALTTDDITLLKKIREVLLWYTCSEALPFLGTKLRTIGIVQQNGENLQNVSDAKEAYLRKECKNKGDFYLQRLNSYLCFYKTLYPTYMTETKDDVYPNQLTPTPSCDVAFDLSEQDYSKAYYNKWLKS